MSIRVRISVWTANREVCHPSQTCSSAVPQNLNCRLLDINYPGIGLLMIGWWRAGLRKGATEEEQEKSKKILTQKYRQWLQWALIVFTTLFHFSSLCVVTSLFFAAGWWTNSTSKSGQQTGCITCFWHCPYWQQTFCRGPPSPTHKRGITGSVYHVKQSCTIKRHKWHFTL